MPKKRTKSNSGASKGAPAPPHQFASKSDFVRSLPVEMSASEVIRRGKELNIEVTESLIYNVRATDRKKVPQAPSVAMNGAEESPLLENQLRTIIFHIGFDRAHRVFEEAKRFAQTGMLTVPVATTRKPTVKPARPAPAGSDEGTPSTT